MIGSRILVVDDDIGILRMVATVLGQRGCEVHTAVDGREGYERAIELRPDLIITDVMMPRMDGWSLVRSLRALSDFALVPVIFLTALSDAEDRLRGFRLGADDYLPKPFRFEELDLRVTNALGKRRDLDEAAGRVRRAVAPLPPREPGATNLGGRAASATPPALQGTLAQLGLPTLLSMLELERKSGILVVQGPAGELDDTGRLFIHKGRLVAARMDGDGLVGREVVYRMLCWSVGAFEFTVIDVEMEDTIQMSMSHLLMEGARLVDEQGAKSAG